MAWKTRLGSGREGRGEHDKQQWAPLRGFSVNGAADRQSSQIGLLDRLWRYAVGVGATLTHFAAIGRERQLAVSTPTGTKRKLASSIRHNGFCSMCSRRARAACTVVARSRPTMRRRPPVVERGIGASRLMAIGGLAPCSPRSCASWLRPLCRRVDTAERCVGRIWQALLRGPSAGELRCKRPCHRNWCMGGSPLRQPACQYPSRRSRR